LMAAPHVHATDLISPKPVLAGGAFTVQCAGSGKASLYIIGQDQVLKRDVQLGEPVSFPAGTLVNAGHYLAILKQDADTESDSFDVLPAAAPATLSFLAKPSRLPVSQHGGITGTAYLFDSYGNLIVAPAPVTFELSGTSGALQNASVQTRHGAAWVEMDSSAQQGADQFIARSGSISSARVIRQVPGDPCSLTMSAKQAGQQLQLQTEPVRDCSGNPVSDGTIVTFTAAYGGGQSTVDVPLKKGIAEVTMPIHTGETISVASGVVLGNQIHWEK
jgi:hypothetical protein